MTGGEQPLVNQDVHIFAWNVESGGIDAVVLADQIALLPNYEVDCLSEVRSDNCQRYPDTLGEEFDADNGKFGLADRQQTLVNQNRT